MGKITVEEIQKKDIVLKVQEVRDKGGRLVAMVMLIKKKIML